MTPADARPAAGPSPDPAGWVERHGDYLYRFALARVRRPDAAEDLVQEALLAAWRGRAAFAGAAGERTWLTAILKRKVADWLRRRIRERPRTAADPDPVADGLFTPRGHWKTPPGRGAWDALEREEFWAALHACLGKLPPRFRDPFALRYLDDAAGPEVCRDLGLTPENLWVILYRARVRLGQCLARGGYGGGAKP